MARPIQFQLSRVRNSLLHVEVLVLRSAIGFHLLNCIELMFFCGVSIPHDHRYAAVSKQRGKSHNVHASFCSASGERMS